MREGRNGERERQRDRETKRVLKMRIRIWF